MLRPDGRWMAFSPPTTVIPDEIPSCRFGSSQRPGFVLMTQPFKSYYPFDNITLVASTPLDDFTVSYYPFQDVERTVTELSHMVAREQVEVVETSSSMSCI